MTTQATASAISLFSGCGGDTCGLERAGFKVVAFNEFKGAPVKSHLANFPESVALLEPKKDVGDITKLADSVFEPYAGKVDVVFAGFPCFVKDTLVLTENGYKEIQTVALDDKLLTHTGKFQTIMNLQMKVYTGTLYHIDIHHHVKAILATEEHPFYVREKKTGWNPVTQCVDSVFGEPTWKAAKDLTLNDWVGMVNTSASLTKLYESVVPKHTTRSYKEALMIQAKSIQGGILSSINEGDDSDDPMYYIDPNYSLRSEYGWSDSMYTWMPIAMIKQSEVMNENVYNFEVETDNSYIVENTIVHNCQGFSTAGKKQTNDPRNQMYHQFVRVARITKPSFIIGENVTGLLTMKSGPNDNDPLVIELIRKAFEDIGYTITYQVLEADDFGVPQTRKRLLIIGWRGDRVVNFDVASFWSAVKSWGAQQPVVKLSSFVQPTLEGALKLLPQCIPPNFASVAVPIPQTMEPTGQPHPYVALKANATSESYGGKNFERLLSCGKRDSPIHSEVLDLDKPCKTIICTYDHQPRLLVGLRKPDGSCYVRTLLPDELKQVQGFPVDYILCGNEKEKIVQVGNAVPPALIHGIAQALKPYLAPPSAPAQQSVPVVAAAQKKRRVVVVRKAE